MGSRYLSRAAGWSPTVKPLLADELIERHPCLFHVADSGTWPSIARHGLLSTTALLDLFEVTGPRREAIESQRRPESVVLTHPEHGRAVVRDNGPLHDGRLPGLLDGCTPPDYYRLLNARVFLWTDETRLHKLLGASAYRNRSHTVITISTSDLVARHGDHVTLSAINSGATIHQAPRRGPATFEPLGTFEPRTADGRRRRRIVEVTVSSAMPHVEPVAVSVIARHPDGSTSPIWARSDP